MESVSTVPFNSASLESLQSDSLSVLPRIPDVYSRIEDGLAIHADAVALYKRARDLKAAVRAIVTDETEKTLLVDRVRRIQNGLNLVINIHHYLAGVEAQRRESDPSVFPVALPVRVRKLAENLMRFNPVYRRSLDPKRGIFFLKYEGAEDVIKTVRPHAAEYELIKEEIETHFIAQVPGFPFVVPMSWVSPYYISTPRFASTLFHYLRGSEQQIALLNPPVLQRMIMSLVEILRHLQSRRLIHCDIKPENLAINEDATLRIFDFGMACKVGTEGYYGTNGYTPPECYKYIYIAAYSQDIWAVGWVILYTFSRNFDPFDYMGSIDERGITGSRRFTEFGRLLGCLSQHHIDALVDDWITHPPLNNLVKGMLQLEPAARISLGAIFSHPYFSSAL